MQVFLDRLVNNMLDLISHITSIMLIMLTSKMLLDGYHMTAV